MSAAGCPGHDALADELRQHALGALDLLEPWLAQARDRVPDPAAAPEPAGCTVCPVCALITVLRGGRSELAVRLAEQATGLLAVLRLALAEGAGGTGTPDPAAAPREPGTGQPPRTAGEDAAEPPADGWNDGRDVQRIRVTREEPARGEGTPSAPC